MIGYNGRAMARRVHVSVLHSGEVTLEPDAAHHLRDVLRAQLGDEVELFDAFGHIARGSIVRLDRTDVVVRIDTVDDAKLSRASITVASAVPKADRADWLVEKLSEIGVDVWQPLRTARSVVHPEGVSKYDRWRRLAIEAAKQSRRSGVMRIDELQPLDAAIAAGAASTRIILSTQSDAMPLLDVIAKRSDRTSPITLLIGPEGGWTADELSQLATAGVEAASLGSTILRIETAAVVAAGIVASTA